MTCFPPLILYKQANEEVLNFEDSFGLIRASQSHNFLEEIACKAWKDFYIYMKKTFCPYRSSGLSHPVFPPPFPLHCAVFRAVLKRSQKRRDKKRVIKVVMKEQSQKLEAKELPSKYMSGYPKKLRSPIWIERSSLPELQNFKKKTRPKRALKIHLEVTRPAFSQFQSL